MIFSVTLFCNSFRAEVVLCLASDVENDANVANVNNKQGNAANKPAPSPQGRMSES